MPRLTPHRAAIAAVVLAIAPAIAAAARASGAPQGEADDPRAGDRAAIRGAMQSFARAFSSRDAGALAGHWTEEGEYRDDDAEPVRGRAALADAFGEFFARTPEVSAEVRPEALRFLSNDCAIEEGTVTVRRGPAEAPGRASYTALLVREEGRWLLASLHETRDRGPSIDDLAWLIGDWRSERGQGAEIRTSYSWSPGKRFIHARFTLKEADLELSGSQVIGVDPATGALHTWTFEADGGVGEADWSPDGDHWVLDAAGTLPDGRTLTETNILRRIDDDTFTWQSIERLLDDEALPDLPPVKVSRVSTGT